MRFDYVTKFTYACTSADVSLSQVQILRENTAAERRALIFPFRTFPWLLRSSEPSLSNSFALRTVSSLLPTRISRRRELSLRQIHFFSISSAARGTHRALLRVTKLFFSVQTRLSYRRLSIYNTARALKGAFHLALQLNVSAHRRFTRALFLPILIAI